MKQSFYLFVVFLLSTESISSQELDSFAFSVEMDEFVVSAQFEPTHYKEAIHLVEVIQSSDITKRGAVNLEQALQISPSIRITQDPILGSVVRMRGVGSSNVAILIDGVPVIGRLNGAIDLSQISMQNIERIEIVEGALSNFYGSNAAGGVINIITKKSMARPYNVGVRSQWENIGQQNHEFNIGIQKGKWMGRVHGRYFDFQQYPVDSFRLIERLELDDGTEISQAKYPLNPKEQKSFGTVLRYTIDEESSIVLKGDFNKEQVDDFGEIRRVQFNPYAQEQFFKTKRNDFALIAKKKFDKLYLEYTGGYNIYDRISEDKRYYFETMEFDSLLQFSDTTRFESFFNRLIFSTPINDRLKLNGGLNFTQETGTGDRILDRGNEQDSTKATFKEWAPFVELQYQWNEKLKTSLSSRYTYHSYYNGQLTPAFQLHYTPIKPLVIRAGYSQGYRSPTLKELFIEFIDVNHNIIGNINLQPEISHDWQITADFETSRAWSFTLNAYMTRIENQINLFEYEALKFQYENVDRYEVRGVQPGVKFQYKDFAFNTSATVGYWSTNLTDTGAPEFGEVLDLNNQLIYTIPKLNVGLNLNHRHVGNQPGYFIRNNELQVQSIEGFDLIDLSFQKSFWKNRIQSNLGIRNLLDIVQTNVSGSGATGPHSAAGRNIVSPGRSVFFQLAIQL